MVRLIGYYEAPDGENEALFIADRIQTFLNQASHPTLKTRTAHCAVLYRTNSQSRLVEEALRRYNIAYTMVGGFSFYERAEIKDLLGYLRLVRNPHDSMALQRVINTPVRGIGKTTLETLERLALETGKSTWDAIGAAIANRLIPSARSDGDRGLPPADSRCPGHDGPDFAGKLSADVAASAESADADTGFEFGAANADRSQRRVSDSTSTLARSDDQMPLLDAGSFSPFAAQPKRPFLTMPKNAGAAGLDFETWEL